MTLSKGLVSSCLGGEKPSAPLQNLLRADDGGGAGFAVQLGQEAADVLFHGANADAEDDRDFQIALALDHPLQRFAFPPGDPQSSPG